MCGTELEAQPLMMLALALVGLLYSVVSALAILRAWWQVPVLERSHACGFVQLHCYRSLREMIGAADLATLLSNRQAADEQLRKSIDLKTADWGIAVKSVEIRDVKIPEALQDAMSRQAQAERERQARVILGSAEAEIAQKFVDAARTYADYPVALHLRGMNMLYESVKERGSTIIVPSSAVDSMNFGAMAGVTSLARNAEAQAAAARQAAGGNAGGSVPRSGG